MGKNHGLSRPKKYFHYNHIKDTRVSIRYDAQTMPASNQNDDKMKKY